MFWWRRCSMETLQNQKQRRVLTIWEWMQRRQKQQISTFQDKPETSMQQQSKTTYYPTFLWWLRLIYDRLNFLRFRNFATRQAQIHFDQEKLIERRGYFWKLQINNKIRFHWLLILRYADGNGGLHRFYCQQRHSNRTDLSSSPYCQ